MPLLVDSGPLYALADIDDDWHQRSADLLLRTRETLLVPVTVIPEVCDLLHRRLGPEAEARFASSLAAGELTVEPLRRHDLERAVKLLESHPDLGLVDCTVVAMAERLRLPAVVTTDRRHFSAVRPRHVEALQLLP